jgi:hypothetical protein
MSKFKDDYEAAEFLRLRGYSVDDNFNINFNESVLDDEFEAIEYLCNEWDYNAKKIYE